MFITCQLIDLLLIVERKLQAIKRALPLGNERSPGVTRDHVKIKALVLWKIRCALYTRTCTSLLVLHVNNDTNIQQRQPSLKCVSD